MKVHFGNWRCLCKCIIALVNPIIITANIGYFQLRKSTLKMFLTWKWLSKLGTHLSSKLGRKIYLLSVLLLGWSLSALPPRGPSPHPHPEPTSLAASHSLHPPSVQLDPPHQWCLRSHSQDRGNGPLLSGTNPMGTSTEASRSPSATVIRAVIRIPHDALPLLHCTLSPILSLTPSPVPFELHSFDLS